MADTFETPFGAVPLTCDSGPSPSPMQAWSQADAYLLKKIHEDFGATLADQKLAVVNDQFGALTCALGSFKPEVFSDSAIFKRWLKINRQGVETDVQPIESMHDSNADLFLVKLPKNLHFFQHLLSLIASKQDAVTYVSGMQKYWPTSFYQTAGDFFSEMTVFPGVKKAKCMRLTGAKDVPQVELTHIVRMEEFGLSSVNYPNVFSREQFDIGARFFLENAPNLLGAQRVMDLACGNGVLGIQALTQDPDGCDVHFVDESGYALRSCAASLDYNQINPDRATLHQNDCLFDLDLSGFDAILCNPPFHQEHRVSSHVADIMIEQSHRALKPGGSLFLLANRHLQHRKELCLFFKPVRQVASNAKFILYQAIKDEMGIPTDPASPKRPVGKPKKRPYRTQRRPPRANSRKPVQ
jgi:16S rRNA G1207 methylase RsmC